MDNINHLDKITTNYYEEENAISKFTYVVKNFFNIIGNVLIIFYLVSTSFCILREDVSRSYLISALLIGSGICVLILTYRAPKLSVIGCSRLGYLVCLLMLFDPKSCFGNGDLYAMGPEKRTLEWNQRINEFQSAIIVSCGIQLFIGYVDPKFLMRCFRPVSIATTLILIGLFVLKTCTIKMASSSFILFAMTSFLMIFLYSISNNCSNNTKKQKNLSIRNKMYIAVLCLTIVWIICAVFSKFELIDMRSAARTDIYTGMYEYTSVFYLPYPFKWGMPIFKSRIIILMIPAAFITILEILAHFHKTKDYKSTDAENIGHLIQWDAIFMLIMNSIGIAVAVSVGNVKKKFKIGDICCGIMLIVMGAFGVICAFFTMIPESVIAVMIFVVFLSSTLEGFDMLRFVDLKLSYNIYTLGISFLLAFAVPLIYKSDVCSSGTNEVLGCLLSKEFIVGGFTSILMDNLFQVLCQEQPSYREADRFINQNETEFDEKDNEVCDCSSPFCV